MSTGPVAVITDSTSYLPPGWAKRHGVRVVPVQVIVDGRPYDETEDAQAKAVADALTRMQPVTTARPSPARFEQAYTAARAQGASAIVVATLSAALSATYESALLAAKPFDLPIHVVDSRSIAMGLGYAVVDAAAHAASGAAAADVARAVTDCSTSCKVFFYVDTLEYLRRGGRVSSARAAVGQVLKVKPLLQVLDGSVLPLEQVRTAGKALARLGELAIDASGDRQVRIAVQHLGAAERATALADQLRERLPGADVIECPVGGVVGAHVGPGMVAVIVAPATPA